MNTRQKSLVLNATYEPLGVVSAMRAVVLILREKAMMVERDGGLLRSEYLEMPIPAVVKLNYYVKVPYRTRATLSRKAVFIRDGHKCQYCGAAAENIDHVTPRSQGGEHVWENVVACCRRCNARKEDRLPGEAGLSLSQTPAVPKGSLSILTTVSSMHPTWEPYLEPFHSA
jgi:5-methylcytosine-specific restriction endonuclease McrA